MHTISKFFGLQELKRQTSYSANMQLQTDRKLTTTTSRSEKHFFGRLIPPNITAATATATVFGFFGFFGCRLKRTRPSRAPRLFGIRLPSPTRSDPHLRQFGPMEDSFGYVDRTDAGQLSCVG